MRRKGPAGVHRSNHHIKTLPLKELAAEYTNLSHKSKRGNKPLFWGEEEIIVNIPFLDNIVEIIKNIYTGTYESEETFAAAIENYNADYQNAFRMVRDEGKTYEGLEYKKTIVTVDNPREYRAELKGSDKTIYIYFSESNGVLNLSRIVAE